MERKYWINFISVVFASIFLFWCYSNCMGYDNIINPITGKFDAVGNKPTSGVTASSITVSGSGSGSITFTDTSDKITGLGTRKYPVCTFVGNIPSTATFVMDVKISTPVAWTCQGYAVYINTSSNNAVTITSYSRIVQSSGTTNLSVPTTHSTPSNWVSATNVNIPIGARYQIVVTSATGWTLFDSGAFAPIFKEQ